MAALPSPPRVTHGSRRPGAKGGPVKKWIVAAIVATVIAAVALPEQRFFIAYGAIMLVFLAGAAALAYLVLRGVWRLTVRPWLAAFRAGDMRIEFDRDVDALLLFDRKEGQPVLVPMGELLLSASADTRVDKTWISGGGGTGYVSQSGFITYTPPSPGYMEERVVKTGTFTVQVRRAGRDAHFSHWAATGTALEPGSYLMSWYLAGEDWNDLQRWLRHAGKRCLSDVASHRAQWQACTSAALVAARRSGGLRVDKALVEDASFDADGAIRTYSGIDATGRALLIDAGNVVYNGAAELLSTGKAGSIVCDGRVLSWMPWSGPLARRLEFLREKTQLARAQPAKPSLWKRLTSR